MKLFYGLPFGAIRMDEDNDTYKKIGINFDSKYRLLGLHNDINVCAYTTLYDTSEYNDLKYNKNAFIYVWIAEIDTDIFEYTHSTKVSDDDVGITINLNSNEIKDLGIDTIQLVFHLHKVTRDQVDTTFIYKYDRKSIMDDSDEEGYIAYDDNGLECELEELKGYLYHDHRGKVRSWDSRTGTNGKYILDLFKPCNNEFNIVTTIVDKFSNTRGTVLYRLDSCTERPDSISKFKTFTPRIPSNHMDIEDTTIERVCMAKTVLGCIASMPTGSNVSGNLSNLHWLYTYEDTGLGEVIYDIENYVPDSVHTGEVWVDREITLKARLVRLVNVYNKVTTYTREYRNLDLKLPHNIEMLERLFDLYHYKSQPLVDENDEPVLRIEDAFRHLHNGGVLKQYMSTYGAYRCDVEYVKEDELILIKDIDMKRFDELNDLIDKYNAAYYNEGKSLVSDYEYDMLVKEQEELVKKYPDLKNGAKSYDVGSGNLTNTPFKKVKHNQRMLSLRNTYDLKEIATFIKSVQVANKKDTFAILAQSKLDGMSAEITYDNGFIKQALTRGDGEYGEDITHNVVLMSGLSQSIRHKGKVVLRGELCMKHSEFNEINESRLNNGLSLYSNPRNLVAGIMRRDAQTDTLEISRVDFIVFDVIQSQFDEVPVMSSYKFTDIESIVPHNHVISDRMVFNNDTNPDAVAAAIMEMNIFTGDSTYPTDGIVIKVDDTDIRLSMGETNKYPRWAVAYKFPTNKVTTTLRAVEFDIGRTGRYTPVAIFDEVCINGTVVSKATLHNMDEVRRLDLQIGDKIYVEKGGEVIPKITGRLDRGPNDRRTLINPPTKCVYCESELVTDTLKHLSCTNKQCRGVLAKKIAYFVSKDCLDILYFGPKAAEAYVNRSIIKSIPDIYRLRILKKSLSLVESKLYDSIDASKDRPLHRVLAGFGIPKAGRTISKEIAKECKTMDNVIIKCRDRHYDHISVAHASFSEWFRDEENLKMIAELKELGLKMIEPDAEVISSEILMDVHACVTGSSDIISRKEIHLFINKNGGNTSSSINSNVNLLIYGDKAGSKMSEAKRRNIPTISINDFIDKYRDRIEATIGRKL